MEYQLLTFEGLLINVWGLTWDQTAHINYHRLLIQAVLIQIGSIVLGKPDCDLEFSKSNGQGMATSFVFD